MGPSIWEKLYSYVKQRDLTHHKIKRKLNEKIDGTIDLGKLYWYMKHKKLSHHKTKKKLNEKRVDGTFDLSIWEQLYWYMKQKEKESWTTKTKKQLSEKSWWEHRFGKNFTGT